MNIKLTKFISMTLKMLENDVDIDEHYVVDDDTGEIIFEINDDNEIILTRNLLDRINEEFEKELDHDRHVSYEVGKEIGYREGHKDGYKDALEMTFPTDDITIDVESNIKNFD